MIVNYELLASRNMVSMTSPAVAKDTMTSNAPETTASTRRPPRPQAVLEVLERRQVTENLLRITLGGEGFANLRRNHQTDAYVKLLIPQPGSALTPPFDLDAIRAEAPEELPARRTYTVRHWDDENQRIDIDMVVHGDDAGMAVAWALETEVGDRIAMSGAGGGYSPEADSARHLLIGDHAALPAIAAALEAMPADARGDVLIHLDHEADVQELSAPEGVEVQWVIGPREALLARVEELEIPQTEGLQVFCHAERGLTKQLRKHLVVERSIPRDQISISAYWALGRIEDQFQAEKREAIGKIDD